MKPHHASDAATVYHGDCLDVLRQLPDASVHAVVTDPPYGLEFMGREWDSFKATGSSALMHSPKDEGREFTNASGHMWDNTKALPRFPSAGAPFQQWCEQWAAECLRVLKPGGHLLAFGGTRTWHRLACAVEDAGFEIRDSIAWLYASGFPKSLDVSKAIDKRRDWSLVERLSGEIRRARAEVGLSLAEVGEATQKATGGTYGKWYHRGGHMFFETGRSLPSRPEWEHLRHVLPIAPEFAEVYDEAEREVTGTIAGRSFDAWEENTRGYSTAPNGRSGVRRDIPATPDAQRWQGWGTALKPAHEPVVVARKPFVGTVAGNVLEHGTGALNIGACRINGDSNTAPTSQGSAGSSRGGNTSCTCRGHADDRTTHTPNTQTQDTSDGSPAIGSDRPANAPQGASDRRPVPGSPGGCRPSLRSGGAHAQSAEVGAQEDAPPQPDAPEYPDRYATRGRIPANLSKPCPNCTAPNVQNPAGRWPANVVLDGSQAAALDEQSGELRNGGQVPHGRRNPAEVGATGLSHYRASAWAGDSGCASRFFFVAKAPTDERPRVAGTAHPTVKPLELMRWLVRLVTPPGGTVLEPFAGTGTTVEACLLEGFTCIAIEREAEYLPLIDMRIARRRDPVQAVRLAGQDGGLFDLIDDTPEVHP